MDYMSDFQTINFWWQLGLKTSEHALKDKAVQKLIHSKNLNFDLIILEQFFHESFLMFAYKFKCPIVTIGTMGYADHMDHAMGIMTPWSHIPHLLLPYGDDMTFSQRSYNVLLSAYDNFWRKWYYMPKMQEMAEKFFSVESKGK